MNLGGKTELSNCLISNPRQRSLAELPSNPEICLPDDAARQIFGRICTVRTLSGVGMPISHCLSHEISGLKLAGRGEHTGSDGRDLAQLDSIPSTERRVSGTGGYRNSGVA